MIFLPSFDDVDVVLARHVDRADDRRALLPDEDELVGRAHLDVEHLLRLGCLFELLLGCGGPGTCASALMRAMCVHTAVMRRNEMRDHQEVDERDHVDLLSIVPVRLCHPPSTSYATHGSSP